MTLVCIRLAGTHTDCELDFLCVYCLCCLEPDNLPTLASTWVVVEFVCVCVCGMIDRNLGADSLHTRGKDMRN